MTPDTPAASRPNRLIHSTSPYLLQHAHNPVDWYPWGPEALERARREDKPILLSIGYAACHWCHVMERESFEDPEIARVMNEHFVCIKVDREERPDIDEIYMSAVQLLAGGGGWPMTMFLTPDLEPFHGGTYFPPEDRWGRPGMKRLVPAVARLYRERRPEVQAQAAELSRAVREIVGEGRTPGAEAAPLPGRELLDRAVQRLLDSHDERWGGFGGAPKFPPSMGLSLLLRRQVRQGGGEIVPVVRKTLERMALGGIYDHLGGGFARYSTDERWLVPHFEKMLYDNALLVSVYAEALLALGDDEGGLYRRTILESLAFVERELTDPAGGFYSSLDADSEGEEGKFYVWTYDEIEGRLGPEAAAEFARVYEASPEGNWEDGKSILWIPGGPPPAAVMARLEPMRARLFEARAGRVRPGLDDKVLTAWNGLMISAFARAAQALDEERLAAPAARAADFLLTHLCRDGRLLRTWRRGQAHLTAYLEDYAFLAAGLIDLYEAGFDRRWLMAAADLVEVALQRYSDGEGGFYFTSDDHETLLARPRGGYDGATPSGVSVMAQVLLRLAVLVDRPEWRERAEQAIRAVAPSLAQVPGGHHQMLGALDWLHDPPLEITILGDSGATAARALLRTVRERYIPNRVLAHRPGGQPAATVCRGYVCSAPVTTPEELAALLKLNAAKLTTL